MIDERDLIRHLEEGGQDLWEPAEPPPLDLAAITGAGPIETPAKAAATRRRRLRLPVFRPATGLALGALACVAIGVGIGAAAFGGSDPAAPVARDDAAAPVRQVSLQAFGDAPPQASAMAKVFASAVGDSLQVRVSGLPPQQPGSYYELWALGAEGRMVSLGNLPVDASGRGEGTFDLPVRLSQFPVLDVSLELADGNPTHSGRSLLRSPA